MAAQPSKVTLLLGADPQTLWPVLAQLAALERTQARGPKQWAWVLSADACNTPLTATGALANVAESLASRALVLGAGCVCCSALAEFRSRVPALLRQQRSQRVIVQLGSGTHAAGVIDLLASPAWVDLMQIDQIVWIPGRLDGVASAGSAAAMRTRMSWLACNSLIEVSPLITLKEWIVTLPPRPFNEWPATFKLHVLGEIDEMQLRDLFATDQFAATHSSWNLRTLSANRCTVQAQWPRISCFDRRAALRLFEAYVKHDAAVQMRATLATERTWYEWQYTPGHSSWNDTEYRAEQRLVIESDYSIEHVRRLEVLRNELSAIMIR